MTSPTWSKEPPTRMGWYWFRALRHATPQIVYVIGSGAYFALYLERMEVPDVKGEWFSLPIQPPETP